MVRWWIAGLRARGVRLAAGGLLRPDVLLQLVLPAAPAQLLNADGCSNLDAATRDIGMLLPSVCCPLLYKGRCPGACGLALRHSPSARARGDSAESKTNPRPVLSTRASGRGGSVRRRRVAPPLRTLCGRRLITAAHPTHLASRLRAVTDNPMTGCLPASSQGTLGYLSTN